MADPPRLAQLGCVNPADWPAWCEDRGLPPDVLSDTQGLRGHLAELKRQAFATEAEELFLAERSRFAEVLFHALQSDDAGLAQEWFFQLKDGEASPSDLAPLSTGPSRRTAGLIGPIRIRQLQPPLDTLLLRSDPGGIQPPLPLPDGAWLVLQLLEKVPAQWDAALEGEVVEQLWSRWLGRTVRDLLRQGPLPGEEQRFGWPGQLAPPTPDRPEAA
ncbi:hypothetical protein EVJ50_09465 [Synechococcus sp. RSCCF101]|uniref:peptidylprolyl isomerase n=1 Tax=Synechococcus sp. RSCCF101 TaxID=2511069 RepID=UPI001244FA25|nr:hypothetical protein [Synechococcus sp. RSCCF101]QEY32409.1 hypothetical protein EVJ50_09465 [Synechococcus sp. RSCCF101]